MIYAVMDTVNISYLIHGAGDLNSRIVYSPGKDENIRIVVTTCDPGEHGAYRLTVRQAEAKKTEEKK